MAQRTQSPIVTGTSVIAIKYRDGVLMAADTLGSYGSMARFTDSRRILKVHDTTLVGAGGELSDFQYLSDHLDQMATDDFNNDDKNQLTAPELFHYLQRVLYHRRNKFDPLWNTLLIAGMDKGEPFLGQVTMIGNAFTGNYLATGFGHHLATPLLRNEWRADLTEEEGRKLLEKCLRVCYYRDCRTMNRFIIGRVNAEGSAISEPYALDTKWDYASFVAPKSGTGSSW
ncbi:proteasome subunit beta [Thraustotheca clavata]|uniref:Proteasome subunit beta n=1 Tax=Thraustotheca clavata TaxID=74557 RepID=A0A1W0A254_9STRA|nr:proteasome subunit beta [Thraustotheca clavata]